MRKVPTSTYVFYTNLFAVSKLYTYIYHMQEIRTDLIKISTYARQVRKSTTWIYQQAKEDKLHIVFIDGIKFVKIA